MTKVSIDSFIDEMIDERGYVDAPKEIKEQLHNDLIDRLNQFIVTRTVAEFSSEEVDTFEKMIDEEKPMAELKQFAEEHIPDYQTFMTSTLLTFRDAYLS